MNRLPIIESYWVEANRLMAGEFPGGYDAETARRRINAFLEAGVNTFFDLTQSHELIPYESILEQQAKTYKVNTSYRRFPIPDHGLPSVKAMTAILDAMDEAINRGACIYVHCWGGVGRTGMVVGCYLVRHGSTSQQALARVNMLFKTRPSKPFFPRSPETEEQIKFVLDWQDQPTNNRNFRE